MHENKVWVIYGDDAQHMAYRLMQEAQAALRIPPKAKIAVKPNLVVPRPHSDGATTAPQIVEGIVIYLKGNGFQDITIMESSGVGENTLEAYRICGYENLARQYGLTLLDLKNQPSQKVNSSGFELDIAAPALQADFLINVPVLKAHCQTSLTCSLKNLKGCIPDKEKRRFHSKGLHKPIAHLAAALKPGLTLVDGLCGDLTFEEGGTPVVMNRAFLSYDPVKLDSYAASLIGLAADEVEYIGLAEQLGVGQSEIKQNDIIELNQGDGKAQNPKITRAMNELAGRVQASEACSTCYGSLLHALYRLKRQGHTLNHPIHIGQGYKGRKLEGIGIGRCTAGFSKHLPGCPPKAYDILTWLENNNL